MEQNMSRNIEKMDEKWKMYHTKAWGQYLDER
jgi:hypothetical protein